MGRRTRGVVRDVIDALIDDEDDEEEEENEETTTTTRTTRTRKETLGKTKRRAARDIIASFMSSRALTNDPRAFTTFVSTLTRRKKYARALETYASARALGVARTTALTNAAMSCCVKAKKYDEARKMFDDMGVEDGCGRSAISYNVAMQGRVRAGDGLGALKLFDELAKSETLKVDAVSVNTAIAAAEIAGNHARALELRSHEVFGGGDKQNELARRATTDEDEDEDEDAERRVDFNDPSIERAFEREGEDILDDDDEAKRVAAKRRKREAKDKLLAEYAAKARAASAVEEEDEDMARRRRADARRAKFEQKRRARAEAKRKSRPWSNAAARAENQKTKKAAKRAAMKADPKVWIEDVSDGETDGGGARVEYDEDGERVLPKIKGPSFLDDPAAAALMNARDGSSDFWSTGFR